MPVLAASFTVGAGTTDNAGKTLSGTNTGTVEATGTLDVSGVAITLTGAPASPGVIIYNSGDIISETDRAIRDTASAGARYITLYNYAGASISGYDDAFQFKNDVTSGAILVENYGTITSETGQALDFDKTSLANITINNYTGGLIETSDADAVRPGGGTVNNFGTIVAHSALTDDDNNNDGVDFQGHSGTVVNGSADNTTASITGARHGITSDVGVTVTNYGSITGSNGSGVGSDGTGSVTNYGTITGTANLDYCTLNPDCFGDGDGVDIDGEATVTNYGTIQGTGAVGTKAGDPGPSHSEGLAIGGGTIVNGDADHTGAMISGADYAITVDNSSEGDAVAATSITNYGTIRGLDGYAIKLVDTSHFWSNTITNYGTISGTSATSVLMGDGDGTFNNFGGSVTGVVDAEGGSDTLNIDRGADNSFTLVGADWLNFETTNVNSGTVIQSGDFTSATAFNIAGGAAFFGNDTLTTSLLTNSGTMTAGGATAIGTSTIDGDFENAGTGIYVAKLDGNGDSDLLDVTGTATLGGTIRVSSLDAYVKKSPTYTLIEANTLGGSIFGTVDLTGLAASAYWTPTLHYGIDNVTLTFVSTGETYATMAAGLTPEGTAAAAALFAAHDNATEPLKSLLGELDALDTSNPTDAATLGQALNELSPDTSDGGFNVTEAMSLLFSDQLGDRIGALQSAAAAGQGHNRLAMSGNSAGDLTASLMGGASLRKAATSGLWGRAYGLAGNADSQSGAVDGYSYKGGGFEGGFDTFLSDNAVAGLAVGYGRGLTDPDRAGASADVTSYTAALYAGVLMNDLDLSGKLAYSWNDYHTSRDVPLIGKTAAADYNGDSLAANVEAGYTIASGSVALRPAVGLDWVHIETESFTETGAPGFNLSQGSRSEDIVRSTIGASAAFMGGPVTPSIGLRWGHDFVQADQAISWSFSGLSGSAFTVEPNTPARDALLVDIGLDARPADGLDLSLAGSADLRSDAQGYGLSARLRYSW